MSKSQKKQRRNKQGRSEEEKMYPVPNRNYKSSIFTMLFSDKRELLGLYNAVSGKDYKDPGLLEVNTLENAIYMAIKNDLSFVIDPSFLCMSINPPTAQSSAADASVPCRSVCGHDKE